MPLSDQDQVAASVAQRTNAGTVDEVKEEVQERLRVEWQNRGFWKAQVNVTAHVLTSTPASVSVALTAHVDEGPQYSLGQITFKGNRAIANEEALRRQFPINDGDIFSREAVATGLQNLRKTYLQLGYINFTSVPKTAIDEDARTISVVVDTDEGRPFRVSSVNIIGTDKSALEDLALKPGQIYNQRLVELFLRKHLPKADANDPNVQHFSLNERKGTVGLVFDFRGCVVH